MLCRKVEKSSKENKIFQFNHPHYVQMEIDIATVLFISLI